MTKKVLYIDMDGVVADFNKAIRILCPDLDAGHYESTRDKVDELCEANPDIFHWLDPIPGAIDYVNKLLEDECYDVYFLSTPMWNVPASFAGKRIWLQNHFGYKVEKRLILTHRKDLNVGHYLVDDRIANGVDLFTGMHIHFGTDEFSDWEKVYAYLLGNQYN